MNDHNFEFYLPPGAKIGEVQARAPNGQPIAADATPESEKTSDKNRYAIAFPLRPGRNAVPGGVHSALLGRDQDRSQAALCRRAPRRRSSQVDALHGRHSCELPVDAGSQPGRHDGGSGAAGEARPAARLQPARHRDHQRVARTGCFRSRATAGTTAGTRQSPRRRTRRPHRCSRPIEEVSAVDSRRIRRAARHRRMGGYEAASRSNGTRYPVPSAQYRIERSQRGPPSSGDSSSGYCD